MALFAASSASLPSAVLAGVLARTLLLHANTWKGSRGKSAGGKWVYRCANGHTLDRTSKLRTVPICDKDGKPMKLVPQKD